MIKNIVTSSMEYFHKIRKKANNQVQSTNQTPLFSELTQIAVFTLFIANKMIKEWYFWMN